MRVDDGVLNVGMAEPVLHEAQIVPGLKQVSRNRMLQHVKVSLLDGQPRRVAILLHERVETLATDGQVEPRRKQQGRRILATAEIAFEHSRFVGLDGLHARVAALQPVAMNAKSLEINIGRVEHPDFAGSQAVPVGDEEQGIVPLARALTNRGEESARLVGREKLDGRSAGVGRHDLQRDNMTETSRWQAHAAWIYAPLRAAMLAVFRS